MIIIIIMIMIVVCYTWRRWNSCSTVRLRVKGGVGIKTPARPTTTTTNNNNNNNNDNNNIKH